jgi:predicted amidohydrolase YtcJ
VGLLNADRSEVERDAAGEATGRLYNAARLLHRRLPEPGFAEIEADTRRVSRQLSAWGVTTIQDASPTNDADTWHLFQRLQARGALRQRAFVLPGEAAYPEAAAWASSGTDLALGPVKLLVDEATTDPDALSETIRHARAAGHAVALHAVSDAEAAIALASLQAAGPRPVDAGSDRIEHGALIPDALLPDLHAAGVVVVGQPGLLRTRGDQYLADHHPEQHPWLYRARSLVDHSITYAASSDAPLLPPDPALALLALRTRETISGEPFGRAESLDILGALASCTLAPARAVGRQHDLGRLTIGALADLVILDRYWMEAPRPAHSPVRLTIQAGEVTSGGP